MTPEAPTSYAEEADRLANELLGPGVWPNKAIAESIAADPRLSQIISMYIAASQEDPRDPVPLWNLSSTLHRVGLSELALPARMQAVRVAELLGDSDLGGSDGDLALAELALDAERPEIAAFAINRALSKGVNDDAGQRLALELINETRELSGGVFPAIPNYLWLPDADRYRARHVRVSTLEILVAAAAALLAVATSVVSVLWNDIPIEVTTVLLGLGLGVAVTALAHNN